jgi:hypothetical protein
MQIIAGGNVRIATNHGFAGDINIVPGVLIFGYDTPNALEQFLVVEPVLIE